jgi:hypothetical protein
LAFSVVFCLPAGAWSHERTVSYSRWNAAGDGAVTAEVRVSDLALSALPGVDASALLDGTVRVSMRGTACETAAAYSPAGADRAGWRRFRAAWRCEAGRPLTVRSDAFFDVLPSHLHFARFEAEGSPAADHVLTDGDRFRVFAVGAAGSVPPANVLAKFASYFRFGIEHIATGYDHLAFVVALLLIAASLREVAGLVTAFTLAHSVTLAATVLGWVRPVDTGVEAIIGFSIALVAIENGWLCGGRPRHVPLFVTGGLCAMAAAAAFGAGNLSVAALAGLALFASCHFSLLDVSAARGAVRAFVAFAFGLVHGFGFAGVLAETPGGAAPVALAGFNVGVEAGQLAAVALAWPLLAWVRRRGFGDFAAESGSAAVAGLGLFWFFVRAYG